MHIECKSRLKWRGIRILIQRIFSHFNCEEISPNIEISRSEYEGTHFGLENGKDRKCRIIFLIEALTKIVQTFPIEDIDLHFFICLNM